MKPVRITLSRKKGWRLPSNTVKVDRTTKWGNPYRVVSPARYGNPSLRETTDCVSIEEAVGLFRQDIRQPKYAIVELPGIEEIRRELRGKNLACWCKPGQPCHADVLLEIANSEEGKI